MASAPACSICLAYFDQPAEGRAVEAGDNWNVHRVFGFAYVIQIFFGPGVEFTGMGKIGNGLGKALRAGVEMKLELERLLVELFLEQGIEHDSGRAGILETADSADFVREGGGGCDEWRAQLHAEIFCA